MELSSSDKERIQHQYDALAKKTLVGEAKSHRRTLAKRAAREVTFSDLSESELAQLFTQIALRRAVGGIGRLRAAICEIGILPFAVLEIPAHSAAHAAHVGDIYAVGRHKI